MRDIVISARRIRRETWVFVACVAAALVVNAYSIHRFGTHWQELFTTLHVTLAVAVVIFAVLALVRLIVFTCVRLFRRKPAAASAH